MVCTKPAPSGSDATPNVQDLVRLQTCEKAFVDTRNSDLGQMLLADQIEQLLVTISDNRTDIARTPKSKPEKSRPQLGVRWPTVSFHVG